MQRLEPTEPAPVIGNTRVVEEGFKQLFVIALERDMRCRKRIADQPVEDAAR